MKYYRIGFHTGAGGGDTYQLDEYLKQLTEAGAPAMIMAADDYAWVRYAAGLAQATGVAHTLAYRMSTKGQNDGYDYDVPNYTLAPAEAAQIHWGKTVAKLPPDFNKELVWVKPINEVDHEKSDWLGWYAVEEAKLANTDGYKIAQFGFSSGEPEKEDWETPGMLAYLRYCEEHPDEAAVALHEYSYNHDTLKHIYPWLVGRFQFLFDACDVNGIARPKVLIAEFGWGKDFVPSPDKAMPDLNWANDLYTQYPEILGAAIWWLGPGYMGIADKAQKLIMPVTAAALAYFEPGDPGTPPPDKTFEEYMWDASVAHQLEHGISLNPEAALQQILLEETTTPVDSEFGMPWEGDNYQLHSGENPYSSRRIVAIAKAPNWNEGFFIEDPYQTPPEEDDPLKGLKLGSPFRKPWVVTSHFNDSRPYGPHEGLDADMLGEPADSKEPVLCLYPGVVFKIGQAAGAYYNYVVVEHRNNGSPFFTWYAHGDAIYVEPGQAVEQGQPLMELGGTGGSWAEHVHINLQVPNYGLSGYVVPDVVDPYPYLTPIAQTGYDLLDYLRGDGRLYEVKFVTTAHGEHQERMQTQLGAGPVFYQTKNHLWEQLSYDDTFIKRGYDLSPGPDPVTGRDRYYGLSDDGGQTPWSNWMLRHVNEGTIFERNPLVTWQYKSDCSVIQSGYQHTWLQMVRHHAVKQFFTGLSLPDVVELAWLQTPTGPVLERYFYARSYGLVGWEGGAGQSAISEIHAPGTRPDNEREVIPCL